jgi:hypothetical protein
MAEQLLPSGEGEFGLLDLLSPEALRQQGLHPEDGKR